MKLAFLFTALALAGEPQPDAKDEQIALLQAELSLYQRITAPCMPQIMAAQIEAQARAQMPKPKPEDKK